jgi:hypothetical protein
VLLNSGTAGISADGNETLLTAGLGSRAASAADIAELSTAMFSSSTMGNDIKLAFAAHLSQLSLSVDQLRDTFWARFEAFVADETSKQHADQPEIGGSQIGFVPSYSCTRLYTCQFGKNVSDYKSVDVLVDGLVVDIFPSNKEPMLDRIMLKATANVNNQTSYTIKYALVYSHNDVAQYRTASGFGVPKFHLAFPPAFRDQPELWLHQLPLHRENELSGLNFAAAFVTPLMGKQMVVNKRVDANAVWKQATNIALGADILKWAALNPEIVTETCNAALGRVAYKACWNDPKFFLLHTILQTCLEQVVYNKASMAAINLAPLLKAMPDPPTWNANKQKHEDWTVKVTGLWDQAMRQAYPHDTEPLSFTFGNGLITNQYKVSFTIDRVRTLVFCLNSSQSVYGGKLKWWDAHGVASATHNVRGDDGEYASQTFRLDANGERQLCGQRIVTSKSIKIPSGSEQTNLPSGSIGEGEQRLSGGNDTAINDGRASLDLAGSQTQDLQQEGLPQRERFKGRSPNKPHRGRGQRGGAPGPAAGPGRIDTTHFYGHRPHPYHPGPSYPGRRSPLPPPPPYHPHYDEYGSYYDY